MKGTLNTVCRLTTDLQVLTADAVEVVRVAEILEGFWMCCSEEIVVYHVLNHKIPGAYRPCRVRCTGTCFRSNILVL